MQVVAVAVEIAVELLALLEQAEQGAAGMEPVVLLLGHRAQQIQVAVEEVIILLR